MQKQRSRRGYGFLLDSAESFMSLNGTKPPTLKLTSNSVERQKWHMMFGYPHHRLPKSLRPGVEI